MKYLLSTPQTRMLGVPPPPPSAPGMAPEATSAMPPSHRHGHHAAHGEMAGHHGHGMHAMPVSGNPNRSANQLNADELSRLQGGNLGNPSPGRAALRSAAWALSRPLRADPATPCGRLWQSAGET
jgi:hypothetical protein